MQVLKKNLKNEPLSENFEGWSVNAKSNISIKLPNIATFQILTSYESPRVELYGMTKYNFFTDFSVKYDFNMVRSVTLTVSDVFDTRRMGGDYMTADYTREILRRRETRYVKIGFSWAFGKLDASIFKMKNRKMPEGGGNDMNFGG